MRRDLFNFFFFTAQYLFSAAGVLLERAIETSRER